MAGPYWNIEASSLNGLKRLRRYRIAVRISICALNSSSISGLPSSRERANRLAGGLRSDGYYTLPMRYRVADSSWGESEIEEEDGLSSSSSE